MDQTEFTEEIVQDVVAGRKVEAIKRLREHTGMGLKEAKHAIEHLERELRADETVTPTMQEEGGAEGVIRIIVAVAALAAIYWFVLRDAWAAIAA